MFRYIVLFMKTLLRILTVIVAIWTLILPLEALAASSASVTSINTAFEDKSFIGEDFSGTKFTRVTIY